MSEQNIIASCIQSKEAHDELIRISKSSDFSERGQLILDNVSAYYERDIQAESCDTELLVGSVSRSLKSAKHKETFSTLIRELAGRDISPLNITHDYIATKLEDSRGRLASTLLAGQDDSDALQEYIKWQAGTLEVISDSSVLHGKSLGELVESVKPSGLVQVIPEQLNSLLDGGVLPGHHIILFARPELGKTLFLINFVAGFLGAGKKVLYVGNEEPIKDIALRQVGRLIDADKWHIFDEPDVADEMAREVGYDNLILAQLAPGTLKQIDALCAKYKPDVLVVDQIRNLHTNEDNRVNELDKAARGVRDIGLKHHAITISTTQAGDSATGKSILTMSDIDGSKTGIPAACDVLIGIGATDADEHRHRRMITLCKNKRSGKHESFPVMIDPIKCNVRSIV